MQFRAVIEPPMVAQAQRSRRGGTGGGSRPLYRQEWARRRPFVPRTPSFWDRAAYPSQLWLLPTYRDFRSLIAPRPEAKDAEDPNCALDARPSRNETDAMPVVPSQGAARGSLGLQMRVHSSV